MKNTSTYYFLVLFVIVFTNVISSNAQIAECDSVRSCTSNALTLSNPSGQTAHYVDVEKGTAIQNITTELTVEMWIKPQRQAGKIQYIAGLWGPSNDVNDVWVLYINQNDELVFEVNSSTEFLKQADNSIAKTDASALYDNWSHVTGVFDGGERTVKIYVNGDLMDTGTNTMYPATSLKRLNNEKLRIQIGSTNALSNNFQVNRTFLGQMDEIRIWSRAREAGEIYCQVYEWYNGNEPGLEIFYRCNELEDNYNLCDATGHGHTGLMRSGAHCENGKRSLRRTYFVEALDGQQGSFSDTIRCDDSKTYRFSVRDTSSCLRSVWMRAIDNGRERYSFSPDRIENMEKDQTYYFDVTVDGDFTGSIRNRIQVLPLGGMCEYNTTFWMDITRITELEYDTDSLRFGLLTANCIEEPYRDMRIKICNNTHNTQTNRTMTISQVISSNPQYFQVITPMPIVIPENECFYLDVRFTSGNEAVDLLESLTIISDDRCTDEMSIGVTGKVQEVLSVSQGDTRLDSIDFGRVCVNFASDPVTYSWANLTDEDIFVTSIEYPEHFNGTRYTYPVILEPETGYLPDFFRFYPTREGTFRDTIFFVVDAGDCTIRKPVIVKGEGYSPDLEFDISSYDFGDVVIGRESTVTITITNNGPVSARVVVYLRNGDSFFLTSQRVFNVPENSTNSFDLTFRPEEAIEYLDEVCFFEQTCYEAGCISIRGRGVPERFSFEPSVLEILNVIGCQTREGTLTIRNNSSEVQVLKQFSFENPSNKFELVNPSDINLGPTYLDPGETLSFTVRYNPNDITDDRTDRAFIRYMTLDNIEWNAKFYATSVTPKLFVTEITDFGVLEVGDSQQKTIRLENTSIFDVRIDSIIVPAGYTRISPDASWSGQTLKAAEGMDIIVEFAPISDIDYTGEIKVYSSSPCSDISQSGILVGRGLIVPLEVPVDVVSFGFVKPCDCSIQEIQLINKSKVNEMTISDIWIDGENVADSTPWHFSWTSVNYELQGETLPYTIPPLGRDTLKVLFCPRTPAMRDSLDHAARIHIKAEGAFWQKEFDTYLSGKRALIFEPSRLAVAFPPTRVDTFANDRYVGYVIPDIRVNPEQERIKIDSITFLPDERVFYAELMTEDTIPTSLPAILDSATSYLVQVNFKPRAVREYSAKMVIHYSEPCIDKDTTVLVTGSGFASAFGLSFNFENNRDTRDTLRVINCDTLFVPIYTSRAFPATFVDVHCRVNYDISKLRFVGAESEYLEDYCEPYITAINEETRSYGSQLLLKNLCNVDSLRAMVILKFLPLQMPRDTFDISVDSIRFDTEEVILYDIIAEPDFGTVVILQPEFIVENSINFDSVRVLDCATRTFYIKNIGDVPLSLSDLIDLPQDVRYISSVPAIDVPVDVGDSISVVLEFCPRRSVQFDTLSYVASSFPCALEDTLFVAGIGYAPIFDVTTDFADNFDTPDVIDATIGQEIMIPVKLNRNFADTIAGVEYWLEELRFETTFDYNQRSLKFLDVQSAINGDFQYDHILGNLIMEFSGVDSLKAGTIAEMRYLVTVPELAETPLSVNSVKFDTDSILFLDIRPKGSIGTLRLEGSCNITVLNFDNSLTELYSPQPNPWSQTTDIGFTLAEKVPVSLRFYDINGKMIYEALDGNTELQPGEYSIEIYSADFSPGLYYYVLEAGVYRKSKSMIRID